jgi:flagellin-like protein
MRSKRGISSILGAVILVQIIIMSLLVVLSVEQQLGSSSQNLINRLNYYSQNSPLSIIEINGNYYITSPSQQYICYIIYPNELKPIHEKISIPVSINSILGGYPWAIIITNKGTWYNVTSLGIYSDTSNKLYSLQQLVSMAGIPYQGNFPITEVESPDWDYLRGISTPDPLALIPLNLTLVLLDNNCVPIGNITYPYEITNTILKITPSGQYQWINLTFKKPNINEQLTLNPIAPTDSSYCLGGLYLPVYNETKNHYSDGYIYYAIGVAEGLNNFVPSITGSSYSYYGTISYDYNCYGGTFVPDPFFYYPVFFQVDINPSNLTVYYYVEYGTYLHTNGVINKWHYIGTVKFVENVLFNNAPLYIAIPKGVYLLNVST